MTWYKVTFTMDEVARGDHMKIQDEFLNAVMAAGSPRDLAMFGRLEDSFVIRYFTPASATHCAALLSTYSAVPCDNPGNDDMSLVSGHNKAWRMLRNEDS